jgi:arylsulfatase A-like enzyme
MTHLRNLSLKNSSLFTILHICFLLLVIGACQTNTKTDKPNVVFILVDDSGWGEIGYLNPILKTPNIDRIQQSGVTFSNFHVAPSCAPTRAQLMSGKHETRVGVTHTILDRNRLALNQVTLPQLLKEAGYTTGLFGKWHLGTNAEYRPENRGFDMAITAYNDSQKSHYNPKLVRNGEIEYQEGYRTDILYNEAIQWIHRNKDTSFFCYIPTYSAHAPLIVKEKYSNPYEGQGLFEFKPWYNPKVLFKGSQYYGMMANIDENIGKLLTSLEEEQLLENTVIIFATDNGHAMGGAMGAGHRSDGTLRPNGLYNKGMRGGKGQSWRGSSCVPLFVMWPKKYESGLEINHVCGGIDILPTIADICGARIPDDIDGKSLMPLLDNPEAAFEDRFLVVHRTRWMPGEADNSKYSVYAIQSNQYRLVNRNELYDHYSDPGETNNIIDQHPDLVKKMNDFYEEWWAISRPLMINEQYCLEKYGADEIKARDANSMETRQQLMDSLNKAELQQK